MAKKKLPPTTMEIPMHELSNYRNANLRWMTTSKGWDRVLGNAKRLAEAVDIKAKKAGY